MQRMRQSTHIFINWIEYNTSHVSGFQTRCCDEKLEMLWKLLSEVKLDCHFIVKSLRNPKLCNSRREAHYVCIYYEKQNIDLCATIHWVEATWGVCFNITKLLIIRSADKSYFFSFASLFYYLYLLSENNT